MAWLLDTNILSEIRRPRPEPKVLAFIAVTPLDELYISTVTLAELRFGIDLLSHDGTQRADLAQWLTHTIRPMFTDRVLPVTEDIIFRWRVLMEEGRKTGHTFSQPDLIIAATAMQHDLTVVTRDRSDYERQRCRFSIRGKLHSPAVPQRVPCETNVKGVSASAGCVDSRKVLHAIDDEKLARPLGRFEFQPELL